MGNQIEEFLPVIDLFNELYGEETDLPIPADNGPSFITATAALCIFMHLQKSAARRENLTLSVPLCLEGQRKALQKCASPQVASELGIDDYRLALLINVFFPAQDYNLPLTRMIDCLNGEGTIDLPGLRCQAGSRVQPLPVAMLDSMTISGKMSITANIGSMFSSTQNPAIHPSPALVQTYTRLSVYTEIEAFSVKTLISQKLPEMIERQRWVQLHMVVEILRYRLHHVMVCHQIQALTHLLRFNMPVNNMPVNNMPMIQLVNSIRDVCLHLTNRICTTPTMMRICTEDPKQIVSDSEELNKSLILAVSLAIKTTNSDNVLTPNSCENLLTEILNRTPLSFPQQTLAKFPSSIRSFLTQHQQPQIIENLHGRVDEEYRNFQNLMHNEAECIARFTQPTLNPGSNMRSIIVCRIQSRVSRLTDRRIMV